MSVTAQKKKSPCSIGGSHLLTIPSAVEEKYQSTGRDEDDDDESSSDDESEDEDGFLATEDLDVQISATLQAIRSKDPRVYNKEVKFFKEGEVGDSAAAAAPKEKKEKPVFLRDYHREKIMRGDVGDADEDEDEEDAPAQTYSQEQEAIKRSIVSQMHADNSGDDSDSDSDAGDFMKRKEPAKADANGVHPSRAKGIKKGKEIDVENADKNPEHFLSNFMSSRAWVPEEGSRWQAFDSDDGESDDDRAETFEEAYNLRFENPEKSNEVLKSYSRDIANAKSVRRDDKTGRQRKRDLEKENKELERRERREDKARLRKLKLDEAEEKLRKVKQAAGATGRKLRDEDWMGFLDDAWDNDGWEEEMKKRFGEEYYALDDDQHGFGDEEDGAEGKRKHPKKPTWDDDIDIKDIVPDFDEGDDKPQLTLSDDDNEEAGGEEDDDDDESAPVSKKRKKSSDHKRARLESQKEARKERAKLEALVNSKVELTNHDLLASSSSSGHAGFRYRETSPQSFGMTARDILLAPSDAALNDFAGLKKLAAFRDEEKKRRDRKKLGKKARLRQWRRDHFGRDFERTGPTYGFEKFATEEDASAEAHAGPSSMSNVVEGSRKKNRSRPNRTEA